MMPIAASNVRSSFERGALFKGLAGLDAEKTYADAYEPCVGLSLQSLLT
jgi:hypothetical protein